MHRVIVRKILQDNGWLSDEFQNNSVILKVISDIPVEAKRAWFRLPSQESLLLKRDIWIIPRVDVLGRELFLVRIEDHVSTLQRPGGSPVGVAETRLGRRSVPVRANFRGMLRAGELLSEILERSRVLEDTSSMHCMHESHHPRASSLLDDQVGWSEACRTRELQSAPHRR
jgi:hypothetical protein